MTESTHATAARTDTGLTAARIRAPRLFTKPVERARLRARLDESQWKVAVVAARAAAGKTTLVADWASRRHEPVAWLTCDRPDRDPERLASALVAAIVGSGAAADDAYVDRAGAPASSALVRFLATRADPLYVVVDDYHLLDGSTAGPLLDALVEGTPDHVRFVLVGRGRPPMRLARLLVQRRAMSLEDEDLVLDDEEAGAMLRDSLGLALPDVDARVVHRVCEGWAGGICLVAMALQRRRGDVAGVLARMQRAGSNVGDLLLDEVLGTMDHDDVDFLLRVSLLDHLHPALCAAITGRADAGPRLAALHRANAFVGAVDSEWAQYRLHAVFRSVLRDRADVVLQHEVADVHRRAADWLATHGHEGEAIDHLLAAENYVQAAKAIRAARDRRLFVGEFRRQLRWLDALPDDIVAADRDLTAGRLMCRYIVGGELRVGGDDPGSASEAILAYLDAALSGDLTAEQRFARLADEHGRRSDPTATVSARAVQATIALALDDLTGARALLEPDVDDPSVFTFERVLANALLAVVADTQGDTETMARASRRALAEQPREHQRYLDVQQLPVAFLAEMRGDLASAAASLRVFADGDPTVVLPRFRIFALLRLAKHHAALGDADAAEAVRDEARTTWRSLREPGPWLERFAADAGVEVTTHAAPAPGPKVESDTLSDRERQVLRLLRGSLSLREIADELYVSHNTIKTHTKAIYRKLGVTQRSELRDRVG